MFSWPVPKMFINTAKRSPSRSMGFFQRNIQNPIEYYCLRNRRCLLIRLNRNRCQYCRLRTISTDGLSPDSVRNNQVPKQSGKPSKTSRGVKTTTASKIATSSVPSSSVSVTPCSMISEAAGEIVQTVDATHPDHRVFVENSAQWLEHHPTNSPSPVLSSLMVSVSSPSDAMEAERINLWQYFAIKLTPSIAKVVKFAKCVPGFPDLIPDDQLILTKLGFFEVWLSSAARQTINTTLTFDDGEYLTHQQLEVMYDVNFTASLLRFTSSLNALGFNESELSLFAAAVLITDRPGATDVNTIQRRHDKTIESLKQLVCKREGNSIKSCNQLCGESVLGSTIAALLGELRLLGAWHALIIGWLQVNWMKLNLPPLFNEIFDIRCNNKDNDK